MRNRKAIAVVATWLLLAACEGGGGTSSNTNNNTASGGNSGDSGPTTEPPPAPTLDLAPRATKTFAFTWSDVEGETEYRLLENTDGSSGFTPVATLAADATQYEHVVSLPDRVNARYLLEACNSAGCGTSSEVAVDDSLARAVGYVKASNPDSGDTFGEVVALSADGTTLAVGAHGEDSAANVVNGDQDDNSASNAGAVYVFSRNADGAWAQQAYLKAPNAGGSAGFGVSLSLSADGDTLAVGAWGENGIASGSGAAYIFARTDTGTWQPQDYLKASNAGKYDSFGLALSLSGDGSTLAVGTPYEDGAGAGVNCGGNLADGDGNGIPDCQEDNSLDSSGAVYVFGHDDGTWSQQAYIKPPNIDDHDNVGWAVAMDADGTTLAVGTWTYNRGTGRVDLYSRDPDDSWSHQADLAAANADEGDHFGRSLALSADGSTLAVGANNEESLATGVGGDPSDNSAPRSGAAYVFGRDGSGDWAQQAYIKASNTQESDGFGQFIALSADGATLAISTAGEDSAATGINGDQNDNSADDADAVYLFTRDSGGTWAQQAYVKAPNTGAGDGLGRGAGAHSGMALSADGSILAVGAAKEDSNATGVDCGGNLADGDDNGIFDCQQDDSLTNSGAVYLY